MYQTQDLCRSTEKTLLDRILKRITKKHLLGALMGYLLLVTLSIGYVAHHGWAYPAAHGHSITRREIKSLNFQEFDRFAKFNDLNHASRQVPNIDEHEGYGIDPGAAPPDERIDFKHLPKLVHLDLKGAPPKTSYLAEFFPYIKRLGATGLLIEYEDMFPYSGKLETLASTYAYSRDDIDFILKLADMNGLTVIPLVQTFGHLEFVLKYKEYKHLRETENSPSSIKPVKKESLALISEMIDQIVALHPKIQNLHIGCDEVFNLAESPETQTLMEQLGLDRDGLFLHHVTKVATFVKNKYPHITPIIWDDMLRKTDVKKLKKFQVGTLVEPMVWNYRVFVQDVLPTELWQKYSAVFKNVWGASAFKGATGITQTVTNITEHLVNNMGWIQIMKENNEKYVNFKGFVLTGWQRYDHFAALCELLPAGIPSLAMTLQLLYHGEASEVAVGYANKALNCSSSVPIDIYDDKDPIPLPKCTFPGAEIYHGMYPLLSLTRKLDKIYATQYVLGYLTEYQVKRGYSNPRKMHNIMEAYQHLSERLAVYESYFPKRLGAIFFPDTVEEWLEEQLHVQKNRLEDLHTKAEKVLAPTTWARRGTLHKEGQPQKLSKH